LTDTHTTHWQVSKFHMVKYYLRYMNCGLTRWLLCDEQKFQSLSEPMYLLWRKEVTGCRRKWRNVWNLSVNMWLLSC
jgi:hypothetical protein